MLKGLDPVLHSELRLGIVSILISLKEADFSYLQNRTGATNGNLGAQIKKLEDAKYIRIHKDFFNNRPRTTCELTETGKSAFQQYVLDLQIYLNPKKP